MLQALAAQTLAARAASGQARLRRAPKPLSPGAVTHDWPAFLGPTHDAVSTETPLSRDLPPPLVWELPKGTGYASPAIAGRRLVFIHRLGGEEIVECLDPETGAALWRHRYPTTFRDRYGYNDGPRSSPVIDGGRVFTVGAAGLIHCLALASGEVAWTRDLRAEYGVPQDFFGTASTPLAIGGLLVVNVGAPGGPCVAAFDAATGREQWRAGTRWGPSYASPAPAVVHGRRRVLVFAGGESNPPTGGLLSIDPSSGAVDFEFPFRSRTYESANAVTPIAFEDKAFVTSSYRTGSALVEIRPDFTPRVAWTTPEVGMHFNTPIHRRGHLYGFDGRNPGDASLVCIDAATGGVVWRAVPEWRDEIQRNGRSEPRLMSTCRGSLLAADGQFLCLGELGHLLWLDLTPEGYAEVSRTWLVKARVSWTLPVLSRGLLYVVQNARSVFDGTGPRLLCYDLRA